MTPEEAQLVNGSTAWETEPREQLTGLDPACLHAARLALIERIDFVPVRSVLIKYPRDPAIAGLKKVYHDAIVQTDNLPSLANGAVSPPLIEKSVDAQEALKRFGVPLEEIRQDKLAYQLLYQDLASIEAALKNVCPDGKSLPGGGRPL